MCRELVTKTYNKANGYETDCEVIYGDTDSVMVHFKVPGVARAMELGREAAEFVSKTFIKPIKLEFEKVWRCFLGRYRIVMLPASDTARHKPLQQHITLDSENCTQSKLTHAPAMIHGAE